MLASDMLKALIKLVELRDFVRSGTQESDSSGMITSIQSKIERSKAEVKNPPFPFK